MIQQYPATVIPSFLRYLFREMVKAKCSTTSCERVLGWLEDSDLEDNSFVTHLFLFPSTLELQCIE
jgi:hypothetical protein